MTTETARLFFAFPADALSEPLLRLQAQLALPGPPIPAHQFHLTLRFLGTLSARQCGSLLKQLPRMNLPRFTLELNQLGCFTRARVVWVGPTQIPQALTELHQDLTRRCGALRLGPTHKAFRPHITLFRHSASGDLPEIAPILYRPSQLCLYSSSRTEQGPSYRILASWPLQGPTPEAGTVPQPTAGPE